MKYLSLPLLALLLSSCGGYQRIGQLTMVSTRNVDSSKPAVMLMRNAEGTAKMKNNDAMQLAVDATVAQHPAGEYLMNAQVYVSNNGKRVRVTGDIYGHGTAQAEAPRNDAGMALGTVVWFKPKGSTRQVRATVVGLRSDMLVLEYLSGGRRRTAEASPYEVSISQ